ncbi:hypothetical protein [Methanocaldococcus sp.]|uniref:hypothetical protein n=1 Tax=Methanocaldococcus sp. TaxID=2152917 RepID=UPI002616543C|nr:hypothetical protein [Methanocaldococcus sp.]MCQ6253848.1 hypothetical protein [Methanocaldococcus sp.]
MYFYQNNENDLNKVENAYNAVKYLENINYKIPKMSFKDVDEFLNEYEQIKSEYENMKKDIAYYQKILNKENETISDDYYELKQKLENYKKELQTKIGDDFEEIIKFLKEEIDDFDVNKETLKKFHYLPKTPYKGGFKFMISENELYVNLLEKKKNGEIEVRIKDIIPNYKLKDFPDIVLILKLIIFSKDFDIELPIPIEVEKVGLNAALEDLKKFIEREHFKLSLPMLVISEKGIKTDKKEYPLKTEFKIKQIPYYLIK